MKKSQDRYKKIDFAILVYVSILEMPNITGGKKYKAGKHDASSKAELHEIDASQGQMIGRIIKGLGDRNMLLYCNDGKERIAHIRGGLRKKVAKLETGDIVLFSLRAEGMNATQGKVLDKGDILAKYEREVHSQLKKMEGVNPRLFTQVEIMDVKQRASGIIPVDDCGFDMDGSEDEEEDDEDSELLKEERLKKKTAEEMKRSNERFVKNVGKEDDIDIDAI
jgi:translation initiation factor 1A